MNNIIKLGAGAALIAATASASALTITQGALTNGPTQVSWETNAGLAVSNLSGGNPVLVAPLTFDMFDGSLGILNSVTFTVSGVMEGDLSVTNNGLAGIAITAFNTNGIFQFDVFNDAGVPGASESGFINSAPGLGYTGALASGVTETTAVAVSTGPTAFDAIGDWGLTLADFIGGAGDTFDFGCAVDNSITITAVGGAGEGEFDGSGSCSVEVVYDFTERVNNPVPAPLALFALGLLGLGAARRFAK